MYTSNQFAISSQSQFYNNKNHDSYFFGHGLKLAVLVMDVISCGTFTFMYWFLKKYASTPTPTIFIPILYCMYILYNLTCNTLELCIGARPLAHFAGA